MDLNPAAALLTGSHTRRPSWQDTGGIPKALENRVSK